MNHIDMLSVWKVWRKYALKSHEKVYLYTYIYMYIYILFFQLVLAVAILKGYVEFVIYKCWRIFDVILRLTSVILDHMQKRKTMEVNRKSAWNGFSLGLGSDQVALKSQVLLSRSFAAALVFLLMSQLMLCEWFLIVLW